MSEIKEQEKNSQILPLLVIIVAIFVGNFVIKPKVIANRDLNAKILAKSEDIKNAQNKINDLKKLFEQFTLNESDVELMNVIIPSDDQMPEVIEQVVAIASKSGMEVQSIRPDIRVTNSNENIVNITVSGDYQGLVSLAQNLEQNNRPITFKSVTLNSSQANNKNYFEAILGISFFTNPVSTTSSN